MLRGDMRQYVGEMLRQLADIVEKTDGIKPDSLAFDLRLLAFKANPATAPVISIGGVKNGDLPLDD